MSMYIAIKLLDAGGRGYIQPGSRTRLEWLTEEQRQRMARMGAIRKVDMPPLEELAGWATRAKRLAGLNPPVVSVEDFMDAAPDWLASELKVKPETIVHWSQELESWMTVSPPRRG